MWKKGLTKEGRSISLGLAYLIRTEGMPGRAVGARLELALDTQSKLTARILVASLQIAHQVHH